MGRGKGTRAPKKKGNLRKFLDALTSCFRGPKTDEETPEIPERHNYLALEYRQDLNLNANNFIDSRGDLVEKLDICGFSTPQWLREYRRLILRDITSLVSLFTAFFHHLLVTVHNELPGDIEVCSQKSRKEKRYAVMTDDWGYQLIVFRSGEVRVAESSWNDQEEDWDSDIYSLTYNGPVLL